MLDLLVSWNVVAGGRSETGPGSEGNGRSSRVHVVRSTGFNALLS